jgi:4-carboxymuconolactone decarboxylase
MTDRAAPSPILPALDEPTRLLVRAAAVVATGSEGAMRSALQDARDRVPSEWMEEMILQSYLFAGFPRALNAAREWRRISGRAAPQWDEGEDLGRVDAWRARGEETCERVYGKFYERLRHNIRELHPALDSWMIVEGYGKVLGRPGLDLPRRELCVVAVCAAAGQDRQLHSHLHGALHVGAAPAAVSATLDALADLMDPESLRSARALWRKVAGKERA